MQMTIGIDPHKGSHAAVAIDTSEANLAEVRVLATPSQTEELLCWAARFDQRAGRSNRPKVWDICCPNNWSPPVRKWSTSQLCWPHVCGC